MNLNESAANNLSSIMVPLILIFVNIYNKLIHSDFQQHLNNTWRKFDVGVLGYSTQLQYKKFLTSQRKSKKQILTFC